MDARARRYIVVGALVALILLVVLGHLL